MSEWELISKASAFVLNSFKLKPAQEVPPFETKMEHDTFYGGIAGLLEGMAILIKEEDKQLYHKLVDSLERVALK